MVREAVGECNPETTQEDEPAALENSGGNWVRGSDSGNRQESAQNSGGDRRN